MEKIGWFFFHLVLLGHVEDEESGASFHSPVGNRWKIFVEVLLFFHCSHESMLVCTCNSKVPSHENAKSSLDYFCESIAPSLSFVGDYFQVESDVPYEMDDDVKLVSKYLLAFESGRINSLYMDSDYGSKLYINMSILTKLHRHCLGGGDFYKPKGTNCCRISSMQQGFLRLKGTV